MMMMAMKKTATRRHQTIPNGPEVKWRKEQNEKAAGTKEDKNRNELCAMSPPLCWNCLACLLSAGCMILLKFLCPKAQWFSNYTCICSTECVSGKRWYPAWYVWVTFIVTASKNNLELFKLQNCSGRWNKKELFELLKRKSQLKCSRLSSLNASNWIPHQMVQILLYLIQCLITYNEW